MHKWKGSEWETRQAEASSCVGRCRLSSIRVSNYGAIICTLERCAATATAPVQPALLDSSFLSFAHSASKSYADEFAVAARKCGANEICAANCSCPFLSTYYISFKMRFVRFATTHTHSQWEESTKCSQTIAFQWTGTISRIKCCLLVVSFYAMFWLCATHVFVGNSECFSFTCTLRAHAIFQVWTVTQLEWKIE